MKSDEPCRRTLGRRGERLAMVIPRMWRVTDRLHWTGAGVSTIMLLDG